MIYGKLDDYEAMGLTSIGDAAARSVAWIRGLPANPQAGRFALDGERIYAVVLRYDTVHPEQSRFETHRRYVDLQYTLAGAEAIEWAPRDTLATDGEYDSEKDLLYHKPGMIFGRTVNAPGCFSIYTPVDAHRPAIRVASAGFVIKLVVKIAVEEFGSSNNHERRETQIIPA